MISRLKGTLRTVTENRVEIQCGDVFYELLVPSYAENALRLKTGHDLEIFVLHYMEGGIGGSTMVPRLIGFMDESEKDFYSQLVKVPGLGAKKALKAMTITPSEIARAIEQGDKTSLSGLPGIGKRTADKIIATLKGKVANFAADLGAGPLGPGPVSDMEEEAIIVLMQIAYKRNEAEKMVSQALKRNPEIDSAEELVQAVFKESGKGLIK